MPKIPNALDAGFGQNIPNARIQGQQISGISQEAFGDGRSAINVGQALQATGEVAFKVQDDLDTLELQKLGVDYSNAINKIGFGDKDTQGYFSKKGDNAIKDFEPTQKQLSDAQTALIESTSNIRVKNRFKQISDSQNVGFMESMTRHLQTEKTTAQIANMEALLEVSGNSASLNYNDTNKFNTYMNTAKINAQQIGQLQGLSGEALKLFVNEKMSNQYLKAIDNAMAQDPMSASNLIERADIKKNLMDMGLYNKTKETTDAKLFNIGEIKTKKEVIGLMNAEGNLLSQSTKRNLSLSELQTAFKTYNVSEAAQSIFLKMNGYSSASLNQAVKLTDAEKYVEKTNFSNDMAVFLDKGGEKTVEEWQSMQNKLLDLLNKDVLTAKEVDEFRSQIIQPFTEEIEKRLTNFDTGIVFNDSNLGFEAAINHYEKNIEIDKNMIFSESEEDVKANSNNKLRWTNLYYNNIIEKAREAGAKLGDFAVMPANKKNKFIAEALDNTIKQYAEGLGLGSFEDVNSAKIALSNNTQKINRDIVMKKIEDAYKKPTTKTSDMAGGWSIRKVTN